VTYRLFSVARTRVFAKFTGLSRAVVGGGGGWWWAARAANAAHAESDEERRIGHRRRASGKLLGDPPAVVTSCVRRRRAATHLPRSPQPAPVRKEGSTPGNEAPEQAAPSLAQAPRRSSCGFQGGGADGGITFNQSRSGARAGGGGATARGARRGGGAQRASCGGGASQLGAGLRFDTTKERGASRGTRTPVEADPFCFGGKVARVHPMRWGESNQRSPMRTYSFREGTRSPSQDG
jgi:hypothetical protein